MRGVAAIAVVMYHARETVRGVWFPGYLAVDFFFLLSGFVIAHAYDERLQAGLKGLEFTKARLIRLYPMFILGVVLAAGIAFAKLPTAVGSSMPRWELAAATALAAAFLPNPFTPSIFLNGPTWSLFYELVANILFAAFHRLVTTTILISIVAVCLVGLIVTATIENDLNLGFRAREALGASLRIGYGFFAGVLIYRFRDRIPKVHLSAGLAALATCILFVPVPNVIQGLYAIAFVSVIAPSLLIAGSQVEPSGRLTSLFSYLGMISYPIYVLHRPLLKLTLVAGEGIAPPWALAALTIIGLLILCPMIVKFYDTPLRRWLGRSTHYRLRSAELQAAP